MSDRRNDVEDDDVVVVCARSNPEAWIESDHLLRLRE